MNIYDISIENFRGIRSVDKIKCGRLNTIVGKNDSGKSCLIKALDAFFNKKFLKEDFNLYKAETENTSITIRFTPSVELHPLLLDEEGKFSVTKKFSFNKSGKLDIEVLYTCHDINHEKIGNCFGLKEDALNSFLGTELKVEFKKSGRTITNFSKIQQIFELTESFGRIEKTHTADLLFKNIEAIYPEFKFPTFSIFDAEFNLDINHTDFQKQFKTLVNNSLERNKELTSKIEHEVATDLSNEFRQIRGFMQKNVPDLESINPTVNCSWNSLVKFDLSLKFQNEEKSIPLSHKRTGFKRLLMVAYFEYLASKTADDNQIFAVEEPETYLHPSLQGDLLKSILTISNSSQFFITTHSPIFAGATSSSNIIIVKKDNFTTNFFKYHDEDSTIKSVINELGVRPDYNLLKSAKFLIFVEGYSDIHFLQSYAKTVLGKDLEVDNIICVIGGGSALSNYTDLDLFKKLSNGQSDKYAVFIDGDNGDVSKSKANQKIKHHCENDGAIFFQLSRRDIENYCHPERIKAVYIDEIYSKEGDLSRNPIIQQYSSSSIEFSSDEVEVDKYLDSLGFKSFKDGNNVKVFKSMTKEQWENMDDRGELSNFLAAVYERLDQQLLTALTDFQSN
ncbi:ATP-dependent nuclease [Pontibacter flavimaris]|uniref:Endonuclease GajA/Old nuclease/RecF-like AAA domain-containing protein n=1 Tax=Pontibacter flavimaris TaxID=1797110 RepID=A0A1Q5PCY0_9BACT|nr:AAA family ATPase [Pontibacter flavimaris]OKL40002.1 hypothetical protein A3841_16705 [Pontibacter flavimaris]